MLQVSVGIADRADLSTKMEAMRTWLDQRRFEPATFRCQYSHRGIVVLVTFIVDMEAAEFAQTFDGEVTAGSLLAI
jgi:hypothetical protein